MVEDNPEQWRLSADDVRRQVPRAGRRRGQAARRSAAQDQADPRPPHRRRPARRRLAAAVAIGSGQLTLGLVLVILAALPDLLDGALAKASNSSSQRGAFFDSTVDRVTDAFLLGGIAYYFADTEDPRLAVLPFAVSAVSSVISYQRAKAESLGLDAKGGLMERAERIVVICVGLFIEPWVDGALVWIMWVHAGADLDHRRAALRQGVEAGRRRAGHPGADRPAS